MTQKSSKIFAISALIQLLIIAVTVVLSYRFTQHFSIIPKSVLHLPDVYVSHSDMWQIVKIFVITYALQIGLAYWRNGSSAFVSKQRFANEYIWFLYAYTTASLYLFLATTINYDPQLIAAIGLFASAFYVLAYVLFSRLAFGNGIFAGLFGGIGAMFTRLFSITGLLALIYFLVPLVMGKAFTSNRDIANVITQVRIWFNPVETSNWGFRNYLPNLKFAQPLLVRQAPGDDESLFILERGGRILKVSSTDSIEAQVVIDVSASMGEVEMENGALGFAFHPDFADPQASKSYLYLYYTDTRAEKQQYNRISRFELTSADASVNTASEMILFELVRNKSGFHNGGSLEFGQDGFLYIGLGEGVHPPEATTSAEVFRSAILRIDVDMDPTRSVPIDKPFEYGTAQNYYIPKDNPFFDNDAIRNEYYALGLRNPFRFKFDSQTNALWLGDIGSTIWEEVNRIEIGKHYQFPVVEGRKESGVEGWENLNLPEQGPVYTYEHNAYDRAVIGGIVNRSDAYPSLKDKYVFADNYSAKIFVMDSDKQQVEEVELIARANQYAQRGISSVVQLNDGKIIVTTLGAASEPSGEVLHLVRADQANVFREEKDDTPDGYDPKATAAMFAVNCGRCHGVKGDGNGPDSALLGVPLPDFTSPLYHHNTSSEQIHKIIVEGGMAVDKSPMMPPWGGFLKPKEIDHLVTYLESLPDQHHSH
ncbi:PQQ-dependent sugar dehydrogenase [Aliiglaciecola sp. LCG003]|uniref:PQQ-dependent sugar dehydrogenase n=1 Tax=Aliiglaciecola sp. LCG003 TaxID=3053655 RepID=UPI002573EA8A|nr:PQQ-dependent sugar dehydrogenase [Aliiglaciecola sp. LCG003]WJG10472.1 PQQ-dependent sugar dehydrogenase [Aliiglaciecola sp. LCG003]